MTNRTQDNTHAVERWHQFVNARPGLSRYGSAVDEPRTLFEAIGHRLLHDRAEREQAFWDLIAAMPEVFDIFHEGETHLPGFREGSSRDARLVNQGIDILTKLHAYLVREGAFDRGRGQDPRHLVSVAARNAERDAYRKARVHGNLSLEEFEDTHGVLPDVSESVEDQVIREDETANLASEDGIKRELRAWGVEEKELPLFLLIVEGSDIVDIAAGAGLSAETIRQRVFRARRRATLRRDACLLSMICLLMYGRDAVAKVRASGWESRLAHVLVSAPWRTCDAVPGHPTAIRSITRSFGDAPGHLSVVGLLPRDADNCGSHYNLRVYPDGDPRHDWVIDIPYFLPFQTLGIPSVETALSPSGGMTQMWLVGSVEPARLSLLEELGWPPMPGSTTGDGGPRTSSR